MRVVDDEAPRSRRARSARSSIRGHNVMKGYWNRPEATAEAIDADGWFRTGDIGRVDEDGYFFIVDRKKDLVIRGGYNVYPREIEEVLYEHPAVREAAVIGVPHDELGEEVGAAVALKAGADATAGRRCARSSRSASPPTSTRATSGSSTSCPRARPARSSSARSSRPPSDPDRAGAAPVAAPARRSYARAAMSDDVAEQPQPRWETGRVEAFSDGVFAIAITLLVLEITIEPDQYDHLARALLNEWPAYLAYVTSFLTVGSVWIAHHSLFTHLRYVDPVLLRLNLLLLLVAAFLPFPTAVMAAGVRRLATTPSASRSSSTAAPRSSSSSCSGRRSATRRAQPHLPGRARRAGGGAAAAARGWREAFGTIVYGVGILIGIFVVPEGRRRGVPARRPPRRARRRRTRAGSRCGSGPGDPGPRRLRHPAPGFARGCRCRRPLRPLERAGHLRVEARRWPARLATPFTTVGRRCRPARGAQGRARNFSADPSRQARTSRPTRRSPALDGRHLAAHAPFAVLAEGAGSADVRAGVDAPCSACPRANGHRGAVRGGRRPYLPGNRRPHPPPLAWRPCPPRSPTAPRIGALLRDWRVAAA